MAKIWIDSVEYEAKEGENLLQAILSHKLDLPYFCWHPSMGSIGACRQCAIVTYADPNDTRGRLGMACMTSVTDGMRLSVKADVAEQFRTSVIEWLMANHPHDCPVCEEGGECHLQDMTVMTGHSVRRYEGAKRTWKNQDLGPYIGHEMNRCITCYRCVRFYDEYAGGKDLAAFGSRERMFFGRFEEGTLESEFAGNLVEVCPTGVFTDKPFAQSYTRKWDLQSAPSICVGCAVGCNVFPAERYGSLKRITNRYHGEVNGYFLCDRGRFGSHFVNHHQRIKHAGVRHDDGTYAFGDRNSALKEAAKLIDGNTIGIGSPRASFEANFALKELVGAENFCSGMSDQESAILQTSLEVMKQSDISVPTLKEVEQSDAILILGEDISNTAARLALSVRQATRNESFEMAAQARIPDWQDAGVRGHAQHSRSSLFIATPTSIRLDEIATGLSTGSVSELVDLAASIRRCIESGQDQGDDFAAQVASALMDAKAPLIITGSSCESVELVKAAANLARALSSAGQSSSLIVVPTEVNSLGSAVLEGELSLGKALQKLSSGSTAVVLENDLYKRASKRTVDAAISNSHYITLDSLENETVSKSIVAFPAATYAEQTGTFVNYESRAQRFFQVFKPKDEIQPSWKWISELATLAGRESMTWESYEDILQACASKTEEKIRQISPTSDYRLIDDSRISRQSHRYSGRTAMTADVSVHEPKTAEDAETPFSYSMEGANPGTQKGSTIPYVWSPGWNSNQSVFKFQQEVAGELAGGDPGLRLIEPNGNALDYYELSDQSHASPSEKFATVPIHLVFGSDELSNQSWPIRARIPVPYVLMSEADVNRLNTQAGAGVRVSGIVDSVRVQVDSRMRSGMIGVPVGLIPDRHSIPEHVEITIDPDYKSPAINDKDVIAKG